MFRNEFLRVLGLLTFYQIALFVYCDFQIFGPVDVIVNKMEQCENPEQYPTYAKLVRKKINRTHDMYNGDFYVDADIDKTVSVHLNVHKWGDGGYKPNFLVVNDSNVCDFLFKYAKTDIINVLESMGRPPACPITAGLAHINYSIGFSLKNDMFYGDFKARAILAKNDKPTLCLDMYFEFKPKTKINPTSII